MRTAARRGTAAALALALALPACASAPTDVEAQRKRDREFLATKAGDLFADAPRSYAIVQTGDAAGSGPTADDAARLAASKAPPGTLHRFIFRKDDAGDRLHRMTFLPEGGLVAGRAFLARLGYRVVSVGSSGPGRPLVLERRGSRRTIDLAAHPRLSLELGPLAGTPVVPLDVPLDPDFDGPLLLPAALTAGLDLELAEIPGRAEVQVALGRPFEARRAWVVARSTDLGVTEAVEVLVPAPGPGARK
jgi:hypothetical protein